MGRHGLRRIPPSGTERRIRLDLRASSRFHTTLPKTSLTTVQCTAASAPEGTASSRSVGCFDQSPEPQCQRVRAQGHTGFVSERKVANFPQRTQREPAVKLANLVCQECNGARSTWEVRSDAGWINIECPCCGDWGTIEVTGDGTDDWDDAEPPTPAAPALTLVAPVQTLRDVRGNGRVEGPLNWVVSRTML